MNATIDAERCIGCSACETLCPGVFGRGDGGVAEIAAIDLEAFADRVLEAAERCPQGAIMVGDE